MKASPRLVVLLLFALFFVPVLSAYLLNVFNPGWLPFGTSNHGTLAGPGTRGAPKDAGWGSTASRLQAEAIAGQVDLVVYRSTRVRRGVPDVALQHAPSAPRAWQRRAPR